MNTISWSQLGSPTEPGDIRVNGVGIVQVKQNDIDAANKVGGDPDFELIDTTTFEDRMRRYLLGLMR